jgi:hypothetical protein
VKATNGIAPQASRALTLLVYDPDAAPGPPTSVVATGTDRAVLVTWAAPAPYFGPAVTGYTVTSEPPTTSCVMTMAMSCSFSSLTNRQQFTFTVTAYNPNGHGAATVTSTPLAGATYFAVTPNRIVDSRTGTRLNLKASLVEGTPVQFAVVGQSINPALNIPPGAIAVTGNLTVTNQGSGGYLAMTPVQPVGIPTTSTLNFPRGDNRANAVTIPLRASGKLWVTFVGAAGKNADVIFDVTGYFMENSRGSTYFPLTPNRLADSRAATRAGFAATLSEGVPASFPVVDQHPGVPSKNVPANAIAVTGNLTVTNQGSAGYLAITPTKPAGVPGTSTLNFPMHDNRANSVTVPISGGRLWVTFEGKAGARADAIFDVTGYFVADATGATYYAVTPNRLVDSRKNTWIGLNASLISGTASKFKVENRTGNSNLDVPTGAIAVTGNLTVTKQGSAGYLTLTPADPSGVPGTSTLNFPMKDDRANAVTVTLSTSTPKSLWVEFVCTSSARTDVIFDVTGYFIQ